MGGMQTHQSAPLSVAAQDELSALLATTGIQGAWAAPLGPREADGPPSHDPGGRAGCGPRGLRSLVVTPAGGPRRRQPTKRPRGADEDDPEARPPLKSKKAAPIPCSRIMSVINGWPGVARPPLVSGSAGVRAAPWAT